MVVVVQGGGAAPQGDDPQRSAADSSGKQKPSDAPQPAAPPALPRSDINTDPSLIEARIGAAIGRNETISQIVAREIKIQGNGLSEFDTIALTLDLISGQLGHNSDRRAELQVLARNYVAIVEELQPRAALRLNVYTRDDNSALNLEPAWQKYAEGLKAWVKKDQIFGPDLDQQKIDERFQHVYSSLNKIVSEILERPSELNSISELVKAVLESDFARLEEEHLLVLTSANSFNPIPLQMQLFAELLTAPALAEVYKAVLETLPVNNLKELVANIQIGHLNTHYGQHWSSLALFAELERSLTKFAPNAMKLDRSLIDTGSALRKILDEQANNN
jgi:hypothetical protein